MILRIEALYRVCTGVGSHWIGVNDHCSRRDRLHNSLRADIPPPRHHQRRPRPLIEHPAPNGGLGDVVVLADGREALVTARVEAEPGPLTALLEVAVAATPLTGDESMA